MRERPSLEAGCGLNVGLVHSFLTKDEGSGQKLSACPKVRKRSESGNERWLVSGRTLFGVMAMALSCCFMADLAPGKR
jgi:hypothetical protein